MPKFRRVVFSLLATLLLAHLASPAAAQANRKTLNQVSQLILKAHKLLTEENDTKSARAECNKALAIEKATGDPFVSATVHVCFGDVADYEENVSEACSQYDAALKKFKAVPAKHSAYRTVGTHINVTQGKRMTLGCGA